MVIVYVFSLFLFLLSFFVNNEIVRHLTLSTGWILWAIAKAAEYIKEN